MTSLALDSPAAVAEEASLAALLRCCVREVSGPRGQVWHAEPYVLLRVADTLLRVRTYGGLALRFEGPAEWLEAGAWQPLSADLLVRLVELELGGAVPAGTEPGETGGIGPGDTGSGLGGTGFGTAEPTENRPGGTRLAETRLGETRPAENEFDQIGSGGVNDEFAAQVAASREVMATLLAVRRDADPPADPWLASEQALVFGHPFHPSPKARGGADWLRYAPEAHAGFPLRLLGVRDDVLAQAGDTGPLDALGRAPRGYSLLPAHPWQLDLLAAELAAPLADGRLVDLGDGARTAIPTSSVRTVYEPQIDRCLKFSLDVRITNCVRKNSWYELAGAVELTRRLGPVFEDLAVEFPGTRWLPEPGYRSADLGTRLLEGLGVIIRTSPWSVCHPGVTPLLSGALAVSAELPAEPVRWWRAYVEHVALPVLDAYLSHGVVLEPHLQNVLIGVDAAGLPVEAVFRDMEGTKLVAGRHDLSGLPERVAEALTYDPAAGWNRVVYCLMVNHLAEIAASLAGQGPTRELWMVAGEVLAGYAESRGWPRPLSDLLAGVPLPAKANLSVRWARSADRSAGYVLVANPLAVLS
ncbi:IucA/IucC family siderophore biosynthesis protein [Streptosporangium sp. 'caverna']|uniref:IucA/IucC family protein n=1 Tax=Streptosporangium sp. 'caverna' TaxID=2202249 RepID=UPI001EF90C71|nr:IucA/IucC family protein [Streptosporangium sp. 'caverna']